jgi:hypothetical protein
MHNLAFFVGFELFYGHQLITIGPDENIRESRLALLLVLDFVLTYPVLDLAL